MKSLLALLLVIFCNSAFGQKIPSLKVEELVQKYNSEDGVVVVNFWSTWCKPCIAEIPHFISVTDSLQSKNVKLMLVSLDSKDVYNSGKLASFIVQKKWKTKVVWLNETNADHYCPVVDSTWSGVIPVTLVINPKKKYAKFYEEELTKPLLVKAIEMALGAK